MELIRQYASSNEGLPCRRTNENFETFSLIWLDPGIHSADNRLVQDKLRSLISYLEAFDQLDHCHTYIQSISSNDRIIFVVHEEFSQQIIPQIHHLRQIFSIYIFCADKEFHQTWSEQYNKVILRSFFLQRISSIRLI